MRGRCGSGIIRLIRKNQAFFHDFRILPDLCEYGGWYWIRTSERLLASSRVQAGFLVYPDTIHKNWLRGLDFNQRLSRYERDELTGCSTPRQKLSCTS